MKELREYQDFGLIDLYEPDYSPIVEPITFEPIIETTPQYFAEPIINETPIETILEIAALPIAEPIIEEKPQIISSQPETITPDILEAVAVQSIVNVIQQQPAAIEPIITETPIETILQVAQIATNENQMLDEFQFQIEQTTPGTPAMIESGNAWSVGENLSYLTQTELDQMAAIETATPETTQPEILPLNSSEPVTVVITEAATGTQTTVNTTADVVQNVIETAVVAAGTNAAAAGVTNEAAKETESLIFGYPTNTVLIVGGIAAAALLIGFSSFGESK